MAVNFDFAEAQEFVHLTFYKPQMTREEMKNELTNPNVVLKDEKTILYNNQEVSLFAPVDLVSIYQSKFKTDVTLKKKTLRKWNTIDGTKAKVEVNDEIYKEEAEDRDKMDLMNLFKDVYSKGDENTKRAMNKSLEESCGTVLSTNWEDVKEKKIKPEK